MSIEAFTVQLFRVTCDECLYEAGDVDDGWQTQEIAIQKCRDDYDFVLSDGKWLCPDCCYKEPEDPARPAGHMPAAALTAGLAQP